MNNKIEDRETVSEYKLVKSIRPPGSGIKQKFSDSGAENRHLASMKVQHESPACLAYG
jgi:hypothetical protein